jgi:hypothetical protein
LTVADRSVLHDLPVVLDCVDRIPDAWTRPPCGGILVDVDEPETGRRPAITDLFVAAGLAQFDHRLSGTA